MLGPVRERFNRIAGQVAHQSKARMRKGYVLTAIAAVAAFLPLAANGSSYTTIYEFPADALPFDGIVKVGDFFYGPAQATGQAQDYGTLFSVNRVTGAGATIYTFAQGSSDGGPSSGLIFSAGLLYGTTGGSESQACQNGASGLCGTVFKVDLQSGAYTRLYTFTGGGNDGAEPLGSLIKAGNYIYGTTRKGGLNLNVGTLYKLNSVTGTETVLYSFNGPQPDGAYPSGSIVKIGGFLFGTTYVGGAFGNGTVFEFNLGSGTESVLYSFTGGSDGGFPLSGVTTAGGYLYVTTSTGGVGQGTVVKIDSVTGNETTLYDFNVGGPHSNMTPVGKRLYGTTDEGGASGCGTIFDIPQTPGIETILYNFPGSGCENENLIYSAPFNLGGTFYGTIPASLYKFKP